MRRVRIEAGDPMPPGNSTLTRVFGVSVGHAEPRGVPTGVTVVLFDSPSPTVVDVRGGASGTFDTASLALDATFGLRKALFLAGGSLYGLDAAAGVRRAVLAAKGGVRVFGNPNPVVPISGAILFDLPSTPGRLPDYARLGYAATRSASRAAVSMGRVGAGAGATVGKYLGRARSAFGGIGSAAAEVPGLGRVGVLAVVNSVGAVRDPESGRYVEGPRNPDGSIVPVPGPRTGGRRSLRDRGTTLLIVVTDVPVDRPALQRVAVFAHDGLARAVYPAHTATDGDVVFAATTRPPERGRSRSARYPGALADDLGMAAERLTVEAILRSVRSRSRPARWVDGGERAPAAPE